MGGLAQLGPGPRRGQQCRGGAGGSARALGPVGGSVPALALGDTPTWWPGLVWVAGSLVVLGRLGVAQLLLALFRRRHPSTNDHCLDERVARVSLLLGLRRRVQVLEAMGLSG